MQFDFADGVRSRLLSARRRVAVFARAVIERELRRGRAVAPGSPFIYGTGGLYHAASGQCRTERDKSRAALSLLLASQRYGVAIDPSELDAPAKPGFFGRIKSLQTLPPRTHSRSGAQETPPYLPGRAPQTQRQALSGYRQISAPWTSPGNQATCARPTAPSAATSSSPKTRPTTSS
jgi:hypothetical protein